MQFVSFLMSMVMMIAGLLIAPEQDTSQKVQAVDSAVSALFGKSESLFEEETGAIVEAIVKNILIECFTNESESGDLTEIAERIPVCESGVRDVACEDVTTGSFRKSFKALRNAVSESAFESGAAKNILDMISEGIYELYIYFIPAEEEGVYIFCYDYVDSNGEVHVQITKTLYDKNKGEFYGSDGKGMLGIGFDCEMDDYVVTTPVYAWQRNFGYTVLYDFIGEKGFMQTNTVRIRFEHGGKHWMFQLWKGNYSFGLANGAEIGIYNKKSPLALAYDCASDEEMLDMTMEVYHNDQLIIDRDETRHWWLCGLRFGTPIPPEELLFKGTVEFNDEEMMNKFIEAAAEFSEEMTVSANGNTVEFIWQ